MGKKGKKTRWRLLPIGGTDQQGGLSLESPPPTTDHHRITFNEDEYTKITTPRQDVLFKKGYFGRKRVGTTQSQPQSPTDCQDMQSTDSVESESYVSEEAQYVYPTGYMDPSGVYYVNGNTFETYDPYTGTVTVVVGPPTQYPPGPPVLAALPCQPVPLQPVEWFNPPAPWCYSYNRRKRYSTDSQNCSAQSSESTGPPGSPQEPVDEGACANTAMYSPQYVYPGYMFGPPVYSINGMTVQGVIPPPVPVMPDPTTSKRRKKRRRRRRGGVTDDGSESSCCEEIDMPGCQSGASSDVVCQSGASSDAGSKGNSDSGIHTDPTPSPPPALHDEEHMLPTNYVQDYRGLPTMLPTSHELIHIQDGRVVLAAEDLIQVQDYSVVPTSEEFVQESRTDPIDKEVLQYQDFRTGLKSQEFTQDQEKRTVPTTEKLNQVQDFTATQDQPQVQDHQDLPLQKMFQVQEYCNPLTVKEVLPAVASKETLESAIQSQSKSGESTPDEISAAEDDVTPNLYPTAPEFSSQESTLSCYSSPGDNKDLITNENNISLDDTSSEENFDSCNTPLQTVEVLNGHHPEVPLQETNTQILPSTHSNPEPLLLDSTITDLKTVCEEDSIINVENIKEISVESICGELATIDINSHIPIDGPEHAQFVEDSVSVICLNRDKDIITQVEQAIEVEKDFADENLIEEKLDEFRYELQEKIVEEYEPDSVEVKTELTNESCSRFPTGKAPVPPPRRKRSLSRAAEKLASKIVEDAIREGVEEASHTRLASPLSITEAVTKWLHSQGSSPLTCPVSESESEEEEVEEEGMTGQKNVRGNPFLVSSHSGAGQRVAKNDCVSVGSSATEWDFSRARDMCDPARSVDKYYRLGVDTEEPMGEHKTPSVYKTAMHIRHNGPFPCGVCCIIQ